MALKAPPNIKAVALLDKLSKGIHSGLEVEPNGRTQSIHQDKRLIHTAPCRTKGENASPTPANMKPAQDHQSKTQNTNKVLQTLGCDETIRCSYLNR